jgi:hypothetical protein
MGVVGATTPRPAATNSLVAQPFASGIHEAFFFAAGCCALAAVASWLRGGKYYHQEAADPVTQQPAELVAEAA